MSYFYKRSPKVETPAKPTRTKRAYKAISRSELVDFINTQDAVTVAQVAKKYGTSAHSAYMRLERFVVLGLVTKEKGPQKGSPVSYRGTNTKPGPVKKAGGGRKPGVTAATAELGERLLQYVSDHAGTTYSQTKMAEDLGTHQTAVSRLVREYIKRGLLTKDYNRGDLATAKTPSQPIAPQKASNEATFTDVTETLIWEFVKATRSTDLLAFLTWLETRNK